MSINDTGAECHECGSYHCGYFCDECVGILLIEVGKTVEETISILKGHDVILKSWEIDNLRGYYEKRQKC